MHAVTLFHTALSHTLTPANRVLSRDSYPQRVLRVYARAGVRESVRDHATQE